MSKVREAMEVLRVWDLWNEAPYGDGVAPLRDGVYKTPFKPSQSGAGSLSISKDGACWKDFVNNNKASGVWGWVAACHPEWDKQQISRFLVERAGLEWEEPGAYKKTTYTAKERAEYKRLKREREAKRRELRMAEEARAWQFPARGAAVPVWPAFVRDRYEQGLEYFEAPEAREKLAVKRGWPVHWVDELVARGLVSCPLLPWATPKRADRSLAFAVECPDARCTALERVGYHQMFHPTESVRSWMYVPHARETPRPTAFQKQSMAWAEKQEKEVGEVMVPALPVVLGDLNAESCVILEGQWDAFTLYGALGGFDTDTDLPCVVVGLRGAQGIDSFLAYWGAWLKSRMPRVLLVPDNDTAGQAWLKHKGVVRERKPTFEDRLLNADLTVRVSILNKKYGKDFNDYYKAKQPNTEAVRAWLSQLAIW